MSVGDAAESRLNELILQLRDLGGVALAAVVGGDGLTLAASAAEGIDAEAITAVAASGLLIGEALGREVDRGGFVQAILEYEEGMVVLTPLDPDVALLLYTSAGANLGRLRLIIRRARGDLLHAVDAYTRWTGMGTSHAQADQGTAQYAD